MWSVCEKRVIDWLCECVNISWANGTWRISPTRWEKDMALFVKTSEEIKGKKLCAVSINATNTIQTNVKAKRITWRISTVGLFHSNHLKRKPEFFVPIRDIYFLLQSLRSFGLSYTYFSYFHDAAASATVEDDQHFKMNGKSNGMKAH